MIDAAPLPDLGLYSQLRALCLSLRPKVYLEIGVNDGASLRAVLDSANTLERLILCDNWCGYYGGSGRGSHAHLLPTLQSFNGRVDWLDGDSRVLIPAISERNFADLILVDGDHSAEGCRADMENSLPLLSPEGVMVVDDLDHPPHPYLHAVFDRFCSSHPVTVLRSQRLGLLRKNP